MSEKKKHLPMIGVGPLCVNVMIALTVGGIILSRQGLLAAGKIAALKVPFAVAGCLLVAGGLGVYAGALFFSKIDTHIRQNTLAQTGVYACVRNPIYSAFMMFCTAALCFEGNGLLLVLPPIFWLWMTLLMKYTEEKWLLNLHGEAYREYCRRVNRCLPWFPKSSPREGEHRSFGK